MLYFQGVHPLQEKDKWRGKALGMENMLDHMKQWLAARASAQKKSDTTTTTTGDIDSSSTSLNSSGFSSFKGSCSSNTSGKGKRPSFKTLDSFVLCSGKKVGEGTQKKL